MNKEHWEFRLGCVLALPVGKVLGWRLLGGEKALRSEGKEGEESREGGPVEVETVAQE